MWEWLNQTASRGTLRRNVILLLASLIVTLFSLIGPLVGQAGAAPATGQQQASWNNDTLVYDSNNYTAATTPPTYQNSKSSYQWINSYGSNQVAYVIYFQDDIETATSATLILYNYQAPSSYTSPTSPLDIGVLPPGTTTNGSTNGMAPTTTCDSDSFAGIGWLVCSVSRWIATGVDGVYSVIRQFLEIDTVTSSDNGIFQIWNLVRTLANVCFIIVFMIIVYSQITGAGISNYSIKSMVPRLIIAAVFVNFSFWICQLFIDASNVLGYSIESLFTGIRNSININIDISWSDITNLILSGGAIAVGSLAFVTIAGASFGFLGFTLVGALISVGFSVLVAFIILAARQAIIVILVMVSPLAFVAMVLPSSKSMFDKWRKTLTTLLLFFPIFAMLFGGSELAGAAIINSQYHNSAGGTESTGQLSIIMIGLAVQFVPLAITPLIVRFSSGILGAVAGMANDRKRGLVDRAKGWSRSNAEDLRMRKLANTARRRDLQRPGETRSRRILRSSRPSSLALKLHDGGTRRNRRQQANTDYLAKRNESEEMDKINNPHTATPITRAFQPYYARQRDRMLATQEYEGRASDHKAEIASEGRLRMANLRSTDAQMNAMRRRTALNEGHADVTEKDMKAADDIAVQSMIHRTPALHRTAVRTKIREQEAASYKAAIDAEGEEAWRNREEATGYLRVMRTNTSHAKKRASDIDAAMTAADTRAYDTAVNRAVTPQYQRIRRIKAQTIVDNKVAEFQASEVTAEGERNYQRLFEGASANAQAMRDQHLRIERTKRETAVVSNTLEKEADRDWQEVSRTDVRVQRLRMQEVAATDHAKLAESQFNTIIEDARSKGYSSTMTDASNSLVAYDLQNLMLENTIQDSAISNIKDEQQGYILGNLKSDASIRDRASGNTKYGASKVLASAQSKMASLIGENIKAQKSIYGNKGYTVDDMMHIFQNHVMPDGSPADDIAQLAASQYVLEDNGNNWAVQKVVDWANTQGMFEVEDPVTHERHYYDATAYAKYEYERDVRKNSAATLPTELEPDEVSTRRDIMQTMVDGVKNSKNRVGYISKNMLERMNRGLGAARYDKNVGPNGRMLTFSETAIKRDIQQGKYEPARVASADPDELARMIQAFRDQDYRDSFTDEQKHNLLTQIEDAQSSANTRTGIKDRERGLMNVLASYLEIGHGVAPSAADLLDSENFYYEETKTDANGAKYRVRVPKSRANEPNVRRVEVPVEAPNVYDYTRQDDIGPSGTGLNPPSP